MFVGIGMKWDLTDEYWLFPSGMSICSRWLVGRSRQITKFTAKVVAGFVGWGALLSCSIVGSLAIGKAEQW